MSVNHSLLLVMNKEDAHKIFGKRNTDIAKAVGISRQAVNNWPVKLSESIKARIIFAAIKLGKIKIDENSLIKLNIDDESIQIIKHDVV